MALTYTTTVLALSIAAFVCMFGLLAGKRLRRDHAERVQRERLRVLGDHVLDPDLEAGAITALRAAVRARHADLVRLDRVLRQLEPRTTALLRELLPDDLRLDLGARLLAESRHRSAPRRAAAALMLCRLALPGAASIVGPMLDDPDPDVAQSASRGLGVLGDATGARALVAALGRDRVPPERVVENLLAPVYVPVLVEALADPGAQDVAHHVVRALGLIGDPAAEEALLTAAETADEELQVALCRALGPAGTDRSSEHLLAMLRHDAWPVRAQAATALARRTPTSAVVEALETSLGDPAWWVRANAAGALSRLGGAGIAGLIRATRHADRYARARAEETLALLALNGATR